MVSLTVFQRLAPGTHLLTRIHTILPLHLVLSLPNHLLAHVPITEVSNTLTTLLSIEEDEQSTFDARSDSDEIIVAPDLGSLFIPGQYFTAKVLTVYPTASQSFISQYPVTETTRLAARVEMTLVPEKVNSEIAVADVGVGYLMTGEIRSEEDKGWRIGLGLNADEGPTDAEGWIGKAEAEKSDSGGSY